MLGERVSCFESHSQMATISFAPRSVQPQSPHLPVFPLLLKNVVTTGVEAFLLETPHTGFFSPYSNPVPPQTALVIIN